MVNDNSSSFSNSIKKEKTLYSFFAGKKTTIEAGIPTSPLPDVQLQHHSKLSFPSIKLRSLEKTTSSKTDLKYLSSSSLFANTDSINYNSKTLKTSNKNNLKNTRIHESQNINSSGTRKHDNSIQKVNKSSLSNVIKGNLMRSTKKTSCLSENKKLTDNTNETKHNNDSNVSKIQLESSCVFSSVKNKTNAFETQSNNRNIKLITSHSKKTRPSSKKVEQTIHYGNSSNKKRLNEAKCSLCEESVMEKRAVEKILDLKCGHVAHDSCIYLFMVMNEDNAFNSGNKLFPLCEPCDNKETQCIPEDNYSRNELISKYLLHKEDKNGIEKTESPAVFSSLKISLQNNFSVMDFGSENREIFSDMQSLICPNKILDSQTSNNNTFHTNKINSSLAGLTQNTGDFILDQLYNSPACSDVLQKHSTFCSKSAIRNSFVAQSSSNTDLGHNNTTLANLKLLNRAALSKEQSSSKRKLTKKVPKPIVKRLHHSLPSSSILSSVNSSFKKSESFFEVEEEEELMIIQIDSPLYSKSKRQSILKKSLKCNSMSISSEHLIRLVSQRLKTVHKLIEKYPNHLQKSNIDSDLGLLRLVDTFELSRGLEKTQNYAICKCYLFEKMLLLEYGNDVFQKITIKAEEVNLDIINSESFRVSFLSATDINIFYFKSTNQKDQQIKKWIDALSNFEMEFQEEVLETLDKKIYKQTNLDNAVSGSNDMIIKKKGLQISNQMPIKNNLKPKNLIIVLQLETSKLLKKSENLNLVNSIKALQHYFDFKKGVVRFVVLDEKSKILSIGTGSDILMQLNCCLQFDQIRGKKLNENLWYSLVYKKYYSGLKTIVDVVILSNSEMIENDNCLFNNFYGSEEKILKIHIGYLNVDYCESIVDLVEINSLMELMEIICFSFDIDFDQEEIDLPTHSPTFQVKNSANYENFKSLFSMHVPLNVKQQKKMNNPAGNRSTRCDSFQDSNLDDSLELEFSKTKETIILPLDSCSNLTAIKNESILYNYL